MMMRELAATIREIRSVRRIRRGDRQPNNSDFGDVGQMIENLAYAEKGAVKLLLRDATLAARVAETAKTYLNSLRTK
ncbi:MAG: hypothetical protein HY918_00100 [Candidatus Doudnabacteria bacterium]|nr:hypothetical protein [Candidatus Doudnabacteria bacterium]